MAVSSTVAWLAAPTRRRFRWSAALLAAPIAVALLLLALAPLWIDAPLVRARAAALVEELTGGGAHWESLTLHYLPRPHATLSRVSLTLPQHGKFEAHAVTVELEWLPLLRGEVQASRLRVDAPRLQLQLPPPDPDVPRPTVAGVRAAAGRALEALFRHAPAATVELTGGEFHLLTSTGVALRFTDVSLAGRVAGGQLEATAALSSPLFQALALEARLQHDGLQGEGRARLTGLRLAEVAALWPAAALLLEPVEGSADLEWQLKGLEDLSARLRAAAPALAGRRGAGRLDVAGLALEARASLRGEALEAELFRAALARPALEAKGRLRFAPADGWRASLDVARLDAGELQALATALLPGVPALARPVAHMETGSVITGSLAAAAATLPALARLRSLKAEARMEGGALQVAAAHVRVRQVGVHASLADGALRLDDLAAHTDAGAVTGGTLRLNLAANHVTLEGNAQGRLDLAGTLALARRLADPDGKAGRALRSLRELHGGARFAVTLSGQMKHPRARVEVSALDAAARVDGLALPVAVTGGAVTLEGTQLQVRGLSGSVGRTRLDGVAARLTLGRKGRLESASGSAVIHLEEALALARARPALAGKLEQVQTASGELSVQLESAAGPLADAGALRYSLSATPRRAVLVLAALDAPLTLEGGRLNLTPGTLAAADVTASLRDTALRMGARLPLPGGPAGGPRVSASGRVGPELLQWIHSVARLPETVRPRHAIALRGLTLDWHGGGAFEARGDVTLASSAEIGFHASRAGKRLELHTLTLRDANSDCTLGASLEGSRVALRFQGRLAGRSLASLLPPLAPTVVRGQFQFDADRTDLAHGTVEGTLDASHLPLPVPLKQAVVVERARLEADAQRLRVAEARILVGNSPVDLEATLRRSPGGLVVDASLRGDTLDLRPADDATPAAATRAPAADGAAAARPRGGDAWERLFAALDRMPLSGRVRAAFSNIRIGTLEVAPFEASAALEDKRLQVDIGRAAVCAVALTGSLSARRGDVAVNASLSARGAPLDTTLQCLTGGKLKFTGRLDLVSHFSGRAPPGALLDKLSGEFKSVARNGRIERFEALALLLRLVNLPEVVRGQVQELGTLGMGYRSATVSGRLQGRVVRVEEAILDAEGIKVVAEGTVDTRSGALAANVLTAPLQTANWLVDKIPLVRRIFGGTVLAVPAQVIGTVKNPVVVPLGPRAVGSRATQLLANTLRLPVDVLKMLEPKTATPGGASAGADVRPP